MSDLSTPTTGRWTDSNFFRFEFGLLVCARMEATTGCCVWSLSFAFSSTDILSRVCCFLVPTIRVRESGLLLLFDFLCLCRVRSFSPQGSESLIYCLCSKHVTLNPKP